MKLILRGPESEGREAWLHTALETEWEIVSRPDRVDSADFADLLSEADAMVSMRWFEQWPLAPRLRLLQLPGAGYDDVPFDRVPAQSWICNVFEHEIGIAEYVFAALLEWQIGLRALDRQIRRGSWEGTFSHPDGPRLHGELHGKTVGLIGYGHIAQAVAARARAFGMSVIACTRSPAKAADDPLLDSVDGMDGLTRLLAEADFTVVACPLTPETTGLIDSAALAAMPAHAVLINVARGRVVDEEALYEALKQRRIGGAVIDVWYRYPGGDAAGCLPSALPFHELDNIIMTPHASGLSEGLLERRWRRIAANLDAVARGQAPTNVLRSP